LLFDGSIPAVASADRFVLQIGISRKVAGGNNPIRTSALSPSHRSLFAGFPPGFDVVEVEANVFAEANMRDSVGSSFGKDPGVRDAEVLAGLSGVELRVGTPCRLGPHLCPMRHHQATSLRR
jgi:hypothetical protein